MGRKFPTLTTIDDVPVNAIILLNSQYPTLHCSHPTQSFSTHNHPLSTPCVYPQNIPNTLHYCHIHSKSRVNFCTAHLHNVREWLWHSRCRNLGHWIRCAAVAVSRWIDVDDLQAQALVD
jgi:hypothetical protein